MPVYDIKDEINKLDPNKIQIYKDEMNRLMLKMEGEEEDQEIAASMDFPLSNPERFISILTLKDGKKDKEIGVIDNIRKLDSKSRKILKEELKWTYYMPRITKINYLKEDHGIMQFDVETDKGHREFETRYKEDIRRLSGTRVIIRDADGNRYEIKDYTKLDPRSISLIDNEI
ncbi:DUF1854 domain-containing protein [Candidatus Poribacteria bacterium]|nr:DUF1854 domain-containing protein [Candidatus Poribacteria bacterium]